MPDLNHISNMLVGKLGASPGGDSDPSGGPDSDQDPGEEQAAEEMLSAMTANDPKAFARALQDFITICTSKY